MRGREKELAMQQRERIYEREVLLTAQMSGQTEKLRLFTTMIKLLCLPTSATLPFNITRYK